MNSSCLISVAALTVSLWAGLADASAKTEPTLSGSLPIQRDEAGVAPERTRLEEIFASANGNYSLGPAREFNLRQGLPNAFAKLKRGEDLTIAYFGTSVTAPPGWRAMTFDWLQKRFPKSRLKMVNASLGGTGSIVGAFRADTDLVAANPDLVFIEFAGNDNPDAHSRPGDVLRAMEGIVRKLWRHNPNTDICLAYAFGSGDFKTLLNNSAPPGATLHEMVAAHYGLPSIQMSLEVARLERAGKLVNSAPMTANGRTPDGKVIFTEDGSHPTFPLGYGIWAGVVERGLEQMQDLGRPEPHKLVAPLVSDNWELAKTLPLKDHVRLEGQWEKLTAANGPPCGYEGGSIYTTVPWLYRTRTPGSSLTLRFQGTYVGIKGLTGPDSGYVAVQVDKQAPVKECQFTVYSKTFRYGGKPLRGLTNGVHQVTWTLLEEKPDKRQILASYKRKGNEQDLLEHPEKYAQRALYAGEILLVGESLPVTESQRP